MRSLPSDPMVLKDRVFEALCEDIRDPKAKGFPRVNAIREVLGADVRANAVPAPRSRPTDQAPAGLAATRFDRFRGGAL